MGSRRAQKAEIKITIGTGTAEGFFTRAKSIAKKLDRGARLEPELRVTFEDPFELMRVMTPKRMELLLTIRREAAAIRDLAVAVHLEGAAVARDVKMLESLGLVATELEKNPGHGVNKVVHPLAEQYELVASF